MERRARPDAYLRTLVAALVDALPADPAGEAARAYLQPLAEELGR
jgi:hypothetical protein